MDATEAPPCKLVVDKDRLAASLVFDETADPTAFSREEISRILEEGKIKPTPGLEKRIDKLVAILQEGRLPPEPVLMARGRPADPGEAGTFHLAEDLQPRDEEVEKEEGKVDYYEQHKFITASEGQTIGRLIPPRPPKPGEDVYGEIIKPTARKGEVTLGKNVRVGEGGETVVATCDGRVVYDRFNVSVVDIVQVDGDVDFSSGNVDSASDVVIRGGVLDLFSVKSKKSVEVGGNVEAASIHAGGDVRVRGGVLAKEKGKIVCGGSFHAKFCDSVHVEAGGDAHIAKEALSCTILCQGAIFVESGSLIGGKIYARNGGEVKVLGSDAGVRTQVGIGMNPDIPSMLKEIDEKAKSLQETADKIRTTVKPLLDSLRRLTPEQREKATELMFQADDLEGQAAALSARKKELIESASPVEGVGLVVTGRINEGVAMTVDNYSLRFDKLLKGPVRIEKRKVKNVTEIVGVNQLSGSLQIFPARRIEIELPDSTE